MGFDQQDGDPVRWQSWFTSRSTVNYGIDVLVHICFHAYSNLNFMFNLKARIKMLKF